jgi:hypothetical protein
VRGSPRMGMERPRNSARICRSSPRRWRPRAPAAWGAGGSPCCSGR